MKVMPSIILGTLVFCGSLSNLYAEDPSPQNEVVVAAQACKNWDKTLRRINLSEVQSTLASAALQEFEQNLSLIRDDLRTSRKNLFVAITVQKTDLDEAAIRTAAQTLAGFREERHVLQGRLMNQMFKIMTTKQYLQLVRAEAQLINCAILPGRVASKVIRKNKKRGET